MWYVVGKIFSWELSEQSTSIELIPTWHEFSPDMGGQYPDFEADEVLWLRRKPLRLRITEGDFEHLCLELKAQCRFEDLPFEEPVSPEVDSLVYCSENKLDVTCYRSATMIQKTLNGLQKMSACVEGGYFCFSLGSRFLVGRLAMGTSQQRKDHFMLGRLPAAFESSDGISFVCGKPMPPKPSESAL